MTQSPITMPLITVIVLFTCVLPRPFNVCFARSSGSEEPEFPLSPELAMVPGEIPHEDHRTNVSWQGRDYPCVQGARVVLQVVVDPDSNRNVRAEALRALRRVPRRCLRDPNTIAQLIAVYDKLDDQEEKHNLIVLVAAWSPSALPFLTKILDAEQDKAIRQRAAGGLAGWNVRRGVAELLRVLEECKEDAWRERDACNEAAKSFSWLNLHKGWGFPEERIREEILSRADLSNEDMSALFVSEINRWFAENEHRFPDWKPGDPLPEVEVPEEAEHSDDK